MDERLRNLIANEVTRGILNATLVIFGIVKEGIMEIMDEMLRSFRVQIAAGQIGARAPLFREFKVCGAHESFRVRDSITSRCWVADMENAHHMSSCPDVAKLWFASCMMRDRARDLWEEVTHEVGSTGVVEMTLEEFVRRFDREFAPPIEV